MSESQFSTISSSDNMPSTEELRSCLFNLKEPVGKRTCAIFYLRSKGTEAAVATLLESLQNRQDSELMRHEIAYALGQVGSYEACPLLQSIVPDEEEDLLVRHEAAEALGAIGDPSSVPVLQKCENHKVAVLAQTCELALAVIRHKQALKSGNGKDSDESLLDVNPYTSKDPALAFEKTKTIAELRTILLDQKQPLYDRYRAMFSLRNRNTKETALILCEALRTDRNPLFTHEVAYVMGQLSNPVTIPTLTSVLSDTSVHPMTRHEAAEALGSMKSEDVRAVLKKYGEDTSEAKIVSESCEIGMDIMDTWGVEP